MKSVIVRKEDLYLFSLTIFLSFLSGIIITTCLVEFDTRIILMLCFFLFACSMLIQQYSDPNKIYLTVGIIVGWFLIVAGSVLVRLGTIDTAGEGEFSQAATGEALIWIACVFLLIFFSLWRPHYLKILFRNNHKWVTLFAGLALASSTYSPDFLYSLAWAFKLIIIVIYLAMWESGVSKFQDIRRFIQIMYSAFFIVAVMPFVQVFQDPAFLFQGGRLGGIFAATGVSGAGGMLFLLSLLLFYDGNQKRLFYAVTSLIGLLIMLLGGGKTAIIASVASGAIFFTLLGKPRLSILFLALILLSLFCAFMVKLPIVTYLLYYQDSGFIWTLTGRTILWNASINSILDHLLLGHGYVSSKFASILIEDVSWPAGHMHNAFLEVLYNNGIIGLILIVIINLSIVKNIVIILRSNLFKSVQSMGAGMLTLYLFLLINGMFTASFGGRPHAGFTLFLAIFSISERLKFVGKPQHQASFRLIVH
jgi:O-antigen ligase